MEALTSRSNWNLEVLAFVEGGKPENSEKIPQSKARTINKLNPLEMPSTGIEPRVPEVGGERSSIVPTMLPHLPVFKRYDSKGPARTKWKRSRMM